MTIEQYIKQRGPKSGMRAAFLASFGPLVNPAISRSKYDRYDPDFRSEAQHEMTGIRRDPALSQDAVDRELARS